MLPDNTTWVLSHDGTSLVQLSGVDNSPRVYFAETDKDAYVINTNIIITAITNLSVKRIALYNDAGVGIAIVSSTNEEINGILKWTIVTRFSTVGVKRIYIHPFDENDNRGEIYITDEITLTKT